jgi:glucose-1-phosphate thymidylyltransferase
VIVTNDDGSMARIAYKPKEPISKLANIGLYYVRDHELLFEGIHHTLDRDPGPSRRVLRHRRFPVHGRPG